jgi:NAD(P)H dehydrogenase (quinone)
MNDFRTAKLAVTGASGHLGRRVVELLLEGGATNVVAITRNADKLADFAKRGVEVRQASFDNPASLVTGFAGIDRLLIISTDSLAARTEQQAAAVEAAEAAGVKHIVYTSLTSPYPDPAALIPNSHFWTEVRIASGTANWSILRNNQYTDYLIPGAQNAIATGTLFHAGATGGRAYVTREDCAAAAAGALLKAEGKRIYNIGGPAALSGDDLATLYSQLTGKPITAQNVPAEGLKAGLRQAGVPPEMADALTIFDTDTAKGYLGIVTADVAELSGRPAQSVADFLTANRAALGA